MEDVYVIGTGMTPFAKHWDRTLRSLAEQAVWDALGDARTPVADVRYVYFANAVAGLVTGQETIRGQVALRYTGLLGSAIMNIDNACASGSSALHLAWLTVASGHADVALAVGGEKLTHTDKNVSFRAYASGVDLDDVGGADYTVDRLAIAVGSGSHSRFMDFYAEKAKAFMGRTGTTVEDLAQVVVKSRQFAQHNDRAQFRKPLSVDEVLSARAIVDPLTLPMCSGIGDGAAAVVLGDRAAAERAGGPLVKVRATVVTSGHEGAPSAPVRAIAEAYSRAGTGADDLDVIEVHDAAAPAELEFYADLGLAADGDVSRLIRTGVTGPGGRVHVNPSGGLLAKGHPVGASGCAQIVELTEQLKGRSGLRQKDGARLAMAVNSGGAIADDAAATAVTVLERLP